MLVIVAVLMLRAGAAHAHDIDGYSANDTGNGGWTSIEGKVCRSHAKMKEEEDAGAIKKSQSSHQEQSSHHLWSNAEEALPLRSRYVLSVSTNWHTLRQADPAQGQVSLVQGNASVPFITNQASLDPSKTA